jgi:glycosyltransferase involved in cell wall biosynthesis
LKIAFISHSAAVRNGAELVLLEVIDALTSNGIECLVVLPAEGPLATELRIRNVPYRVLSYAWWASPGRNVLTRARKLLRNLVTGIQVARIVKRERCTTVYTNTLVIPVGAVAARIARVPHVWHIHEFGTLDHGFKFDWGERLSFALVNRLSAVCVANSDCVRSHFVRFIDSQKLRRVYCSMHLSSRDSPRLPTRADPATLDLRCVLVGRLAPSKGQDDAVRAIAELARNGHRVELDLVGGGSAEFLEALKDLVRENEIQDRVHFLGATDDPSSLVHAADVALMCSRAEAFGRVTVEGMLAGKAVIGARSGATPELIRPGATGLLYTPGNYRELAALIQYLSDNRTVAEHLGRAARAWALATFSETRLASELISTIPNLTEEPAWQHARTI